MIFGLIPLGCIGTIAEAVEKAKEDKVKKPLRFKGDVINSYGVWGAEIELSEADPNTKVIRACLEYTKKDKINYPLMFNHKQISLADIDRLLGDSEPKEIACPCGCGMTVKAKPSVEPKEPEGKIDTLSKPIVSKDDDIDYALVVNKINEIIEKING